MNKMSMATKAGIGQKLPRCRIQVHGEGPRHARIMLVGEAPGREEVEQRRPFVGRAGRFLDKVLDAAGIDRRKCYVTNVVKFRPTRVVQIAAPAKSRGAIRLRIARAAALVKLQDRPPTDAELAACAPVLKREILRVRPRLIVLLGATALRALVGPEERLAEVRGRLLKRGKLLFLPTYHPAAAMRNRKIRAKFVEDIRSAAKLQVLKHSARYRNA